MHSAAPVFRGGAPYGVLLLLLALPRVHAQDRPAPWYERIRVSGDFRFRTESFMQEGEPGRTRFRIRARVGATTNLGDNFTAGLRLATNQPGNITSANVTLGDATAPKSFRLDRAYLTWTPGSWEFSAGKFALPLERPQGLIRSELIFDDEIAPEGLHERLTVFRSDEGILRRLAIQAEQWSMQEASTDDAWMFGGQASADLALGRVAVDLHAGYYDFQRGRLLARARNGNDQLLITNDVRTRSGALVEGGTAVSPDPDDPFDRFEHDFRVGSASAGVAIPGVAGRTLSLFAEGARNTAIGDRNLGIWTGVSYGAVRAPGDWAVHVGWTRLEQEAVLSMFSYSDLGFGGTNTYGPILQGTWRPRGPVILQVRHHIMKPIRDAGENPSPVHRLQVDARVSF